MLKINKTTFFRSYLLLEKKMSTYIALDIETTGFDPEKDQIIEIGIIKFNENEIIDTYETLINPGREIPPFISHMTGIKDEYLTDAPTLEQIKDELVKFIGNYPIVGHNINFDITFLKQKGVPIFNEEYDTLQLSSMLIPHLPSYSLDTLTRTLKIEHLNRHRALSDTRASYDLFMILLGKIREIDSDTLFEIKKILDRSTWPLKALFHVSPNTHEKLSSAKPPEDTNLKNNIQLTQDQLETFFNQEGPFSKTISNYESRPSQKTITEKILNSFENEYHHLLEAGTGTGKTIAYLLAAIYFAKKNNTKIVISTHTKNLQDQIINKDIPLLKKALTQIDPNLSFNTALLKGRRNYISLKRVQTFMDKPAFDDCETTFLLKIILWLKQTQTGDLEELSIQGKEYPLKDDVCCDEFSDIEDIGNKDFLIKARNKAEKADIIIVNHALLLQDAISESSLIPSYDYVIFDEAHHLEKVTTESMTINLSLTYFTKVYERIIRNLATLNQTDLISNVSSKTHQILSRTEIFFGLLGIFIEKFAHPDAYQSQFLVRDQAINSIEWHKVKDSAEIISDLNRQLLNELDILFNHLLPDNQEVARELKNNVFEIENRVESIKTIFLNDQWQNRINWTYKTYDGLGCLKSAPLQIGSILNDLFYSNKKSIILTSATLRTDHSFFYLRKSLSLDERFEETELPSHFDYPDQVKIIIPEDLPKPATEGYFKACSNIIYDTIIKNGGRTLVLFTAKQALMATYMELAPKLKEKGFDLLAQGISGGKGKILEHFKEEPQNAALFGTDSFWEGVDIAGDLLTCIIMQKLPFDPPTDPIIFSRGKEYQDSFNEYQLPRAILKFKQGFGRLIRTSRDKGSMIILDPRVIQSGYGHQFLESLPNGIKVEIVTSDEVGNLLQNK